MKMRTMSVVTNSHRVLGPLLAGCFSALALFVSPIAPPARAEEDDAKLCEQQTQAHNAMRACTRLLMSDELDNAGRVRLLMLRANAWFVLWDMAAAADDFSDVLKIEPSNITALLGRAEAHRHTGQYEKAAADWGAIAGIKPNDLAAHVQHGQNLILAHKFEDARAAFVRALAIDAKSVESYAGLASALDQLGQKEEAAKNFAAALAINPNDAPTHIARAEAAERSGDRKLAIESYSAAVRLNGMQLRPRQALQRLGVETPP